jgi:hypothetical protein
VDADTFTMQAKNVQTNIICQKADGICFLGQERSADGGIHATGDHNTVTIVLWNTKKLCRAIQNIRRGVLLHNNVRPHTAGHTQALLEHFNLELFYHPPCSLELALSDYHQFTYQKN